MAESEDSSKMSMPNITPETEWSTREKLAIASYVQRSGEQHWSGAGRLLRPLGEVDRPSEWFSPKFCAQQYTALLEQASAPRRKRSERTESSEVAPPNLPPEEAILNRLTKERIEELKKHVRNERMEYRKLKREIEMIENGELDEKLDELLQDIDRFEASEADTMTAVEEPPSTEPSSIPTVQELPEPAAAEASDVMEIENQDTVTDTSVSQTQNNEQTSQDNTPSDCEEDTPIKTESADDDVSDEKHPLPVLEKIAQEESPPTTDDQPLEISPKRTSPDLTPEVKEEVKDPESEIVEVEKNLPEPDNVPVEENIIEKAENVEPETVEEIPCNSETENVMEVEPSVDIPPQKKTDSEPVEVTDVTVLETSNAESKTSETITEEEEPKNPPSAPVTPGHSGHFAYDSHFPSSPALSHSSDFDPESSASSKAWKKSIMILYKQVASHRYASLFLQPVTDEIAPNYSSTVYRSIDLLTIKRHIESGVIRTTAEFRRDIMLMFQNALMYNNAEHDVYKWTLEMQKEFLDQIAQFIATQMMVETAQPPENKSLRRSTMRRSVLLEKSSQNTRSRRSAVSDTDSKSSH